MLTELKPAPRLLHCLGDHGCTVGKVPWRLLSSQNTCRKPDMCCVDGSGSDCKPTSGSRSTPKN